MSESKPKWAGAREGITSPTVGEILDAIAIEVDSAIAKHGPWPDSCHHGHSVLLEEVEELWAEIKADKGRLGPAKREAIQVAAVAVRYVMELCYHEQKPAAPKVSPRCMVCGKMCDDGKRFCPVCDSAAVHSMAGSPAAPWCSHCDTRQATEKDGLCNHCRPF